MSDDERQLSEEEEEEAPARKSEEEEDTKAEAMPEPEPEPAEHAADDEPPSPVKKMAAPVKAGPSEAELAMQKRRQRNIDSAGLDEQAQELLEQNKVEREKMEEEIEELRARSELRKKEREEEERRNAERREEEERRRKAEEEERRARKEEEEAKRRAARMAKMAEFEKWKQPTGRNFVITKRGDGTTSVEDQDESGSSLPKKSKEQLEAEKKTILSQRIQPLEISGYDAAKLADKAKELHGLVYRLEGERYDLEKRFKAQQYDMQELAERARQMNKVGKDGAVTRVHEEVDKVQERFAGAPSKVVMFSKYERQKDKRSYGNRRDIFTGPVYGYPAERIKPKRIVAWDENTGLPLYKEGDSVEEPAPVAQEAGGEEEE